MVKVINNICAVAQHLDDDAQTAALSTNCTSLYGTIQSASREADAHLHLLPRSRLPGVIPPLPHTSWRAA